MMNSLTKLPGGYIQAYKKSSKKRPKYILKSISFCWKILVPGCTNQKPVKMSLGALGLYMSRLPKRPYTMDFDLI